MKMNKIVVTLIAAGILASPLAQAVTNGNEMMAVGSQSTALGGTGVANFIGAESTFANPAMLGKSKGREVTGGLNYFTPNVSSTGMPGAPYIDSTADTNYIPDVSYSNRMDDKMTWGIAMAGIAGMGVDYTDASLALGHIKAKTDMSILRIIPTFAYNDKQYGVGVSPVFQYGTLGISYDTTGSPGGGPYNAAQNKDSATGWGINLGGYYNVTPEVTVGAAYQSEIATSYGKQISGAGAGFGLFSGSPFGAAFGDDMNQPAQVKLGVAYSMGNITVTADYKTIMWGSAKGFKDFGWENQDIMALGAKYSGNNYWVGAGYNHGKDPIKPKATGVYRDDAIDLFNNLFFPAIVKTTFTLGGGYDISKDMTIEGVYAMSPEYEKVVAVANFGGTNSTKHSQQTIEVSLRYKY